MNTLNITMPIYKKAYMPRAKKDALLGLNWLIGASNVMGRGVRANTGLAVMKKLIHQVVLDNKELILSENPNWNPEHGQGFHVKYKVYAGRLGSDGHNIRSAMEKMALDAIEEAGLIDNDKYVYTTESQFYLQRSNPRIEIEISHIEEEYQYIID